jgi:hypothetical protein
MSDDKLEKIEDGLTELISKFSELVGEFKYYRKEMDETKAENKSLDIRLRSVEQQMPLLKQMSDNNNKIKNSIIGAILVAAIIGGIIAKFSGS